MLFRGRPTGPPPLQPTKYDFRNERIDPASFRSDHYFKAYESEPDGDDDYDPEEEARLRRRKAKPKTVRKPKEITSKEDNIPEPAEPTTPAKEDTAIPSLVTLKLKSDRGRSLLHELAGVHGKGRGYDQHQYILPPPASNPLDRSNPELEAYPREEASHYQAINQYHASKSIEDIEKDSNVRELRSRKVDKTLPPPKPARPKSNAAKSTPSDRPTCTNCRAQNKKCDLRSAKDHSCIHCIASGSVCVVEGAPIRPPKEDQLVRPAFDTPGGKSLVKDLAASRISAVETSTLGAFAPSSTVLRSKMPIDNQRSMMDLPQGTRAAFDRSKTREQGFKTEEDLRLEARSRPTLAAMSTLQAPQSAPSPPMDVLTITTSWCHPVNYNFQVLTNPLNPKHPAVPCHFCHDFRYSVFGCGQRTIQVTRNERNHTFIEVKRTHIQTTRICFTHALMYIRQSKCQHKFYPTAGVTSIPYLRPHQWKASMMNHSENRVLKIAYPCCSMCPTPAVYGCPLSSTVKYVQGGKQVEIAKQPCRFLLCEGCKRTFGESGASQSQLEASIRARGIMPRADIDFLYAGSDLHKVYGADG